MSLCYDGDGRFRLLRSLFRLPLRRSAAGPCSQGYGPAGAGTFLLRRRCSTKGFNFPAFFSAFFENLCFSFVLCIQSYASAAMPPQPLKRALLPRLLQGRRFSRPQICGASAGRFCASAGPSSAVLHGCRIAIYHLFAFFAASRAFCALHGRFIVRTCKHAYRALSVRLKGIHALRVHAAAAALPPPLPCLPSGHHGPAAGGRCPYNWPAVSCTYKLVPTGDLYVQPRTALSPHSAPQK